MNYQSLKIDLTNYQTTIDRDIFSNLDKHSDIPIRQFKHFWKNSIWMNVIGKLTVPWSDVIVQEKNFRSQISFLSDRFFSTTGLLHDDFLDGSKLNGLTKNLSKVLVVQKFTAQSSGRTKKSLSKKSSSKEPAPHEINAKCCQV